MLFLKINIYFSKKTQFLNVLRIHFVPVAFYGIFATFCGKVNSRSDVHDNADVGLNAIGRHRVEEKMSEIAHLRRRFCFQFFYGTKQKLNLILKLDASILRVEHVTHQYNRKVLSFRSWYHWQNYAHLQSADWSLKAKCWEKKIDSMSQYRFILIACFHTSFLVAERFFWAKRTSSVDKLQKRSFSVKESKSISLEKNRWTYMVNCSTLFLYISL